MAKEGEWLGFGGASQSGWGMGLIEVRVSTGGVGWQWMTLPRSQIESLVKLANANPKIRDQIMADAKPAIGSWR